MRAAADSGAKPRRELKRSGWSGIPRRSVVRAEERRPEQQSSRGQRSLKYCGPSRSSQRPCHRPPRSRPPRRRRPACPRRRWSRPLDPHRGRSPPPAAEHTSSKLQRPARRHSQYRVCCVPNGARSQAEAAVPGSGGYGGWRQAREHHRPAAGELECVGFAQPIAGAGDDDRPPIKAQARHPATANAPLQRPSRASVGGCRLSRLPPPDPAEIGRADAKRDAPVALFF